MPGPKRSQQPDHLGLMFIKERARRRLSRIVEGPQKKDVIGGSTLRRRLSASFDGTPKISKYYFELFGHLLQWWEEFGPEREERGQLSLLSCSGIRDLDRDERTNLPPGTKGGFCITDAASDLNARRGDIFLYCENLQDLKDWLTALRSSFARFNISPLAGLGPQQAANEKPILEGELLSRDTLDGLLQPTWTLLKVALFDNRIECRRVSSGNPSTEIPTSPISTRRKSLSQSVSELISSNNSPDQLPPCRVDRFTVNFYVQDSRVHPHAFLISDLIVTHYFAAKDSMEKLFWMQTMAKAIKNLVAMHEHAFKIRDALATTSSSSTAKSQSKSKHDSDSDDDDDDDDDEEEVDEEEMDKRRPPQVRRESMRRFYGMQKPPEDELSEPPLARRMSRATKTKDLEEDESDSDEDVTKTVVKLDKLKTVLSSSPDVRPNNSTSSYSNQSFAASTPTTTGGPRSTPTPQTTSSQKGDSSFSSKQQQSNTIVVGKASPSLPQAAKPSPSSASPAAIAAANRPVPNTSPVKINGSPSQGPKPTSNASPSPNSKPASSPTASSMDSPVLGGDKKNLAQNLSKMGSSTSGLLNPRSLAKRLSAGTKGNNSGSGVLAVYSAFESIAPEWEDEKIQQLISVAKAIDKKADSTAKLTFGQLVQAWGEENEELGAVVERARRKKIAKYEGDMLFQGYDDAVVIEIKLK